jgi:hypothetical protein
MPFLLRKDYPGDRSQYVVILPGFENLIGPESVTYDPDKTRATPFLTWHETDQAQDKLDACFGTLVVLEVK